LAVTEIWYCYEIDDMFSYKHKPVDAPRLVVPWLDKGTDEVGTRVYHRYTIEIPDKEDECLPTS
jgi:hypothetical protein